MKAYSVYGARSLTRQARPRGSREAADAANKAEPPAMRGRRVKGCEAMPYSKANVAYYKSRQRCARCGQQDAFTLNGRSICADCAEKQREAHKRYRAENSAELSAQNKAWRAKMAEAGLCPKCGKPSDSGHVHCRRCLAVTRERMKNKRRENGAAPRGECGLCYTCNKRPALDGKRLCRECYDKSLVSMAKARANKRPRETP